MTHTEPSVKSPRPGRAYGAYGAYTIMLVLAVASYLGIRHYGESLVAPPHSVANVTQAGHAPEQLLLHVLLALIVVILVSRALGAVFRYLHQPAVIGEVIAGIVLGPSLFGKVAPSLSAFILPASIAPHLGVIAQVGVILFMFLVGLELNTRLLRERSHSLLAISHASIVVPFLLGSALALWLYPELSSSDVGFTNFSLFLGVAMSVTAFPVLARILTDRGMHRSSLGALALACAAVDDATAWCLLALVVSIVRAKAASSFLIVGLTLAYILVMVLFVGPLLQRAVARQDLRGRLSQGELAAMFIGLLLSALITEAIGVHALFGAFLLGAIVPHESLLAREVTRRLEDFIVVLLLPAFFAFTGMRTQIGLLSSALDWVLCGAIVVVACVGKFGGSALAARLSGLGWRDAASLGVLMNTRGLMELVVLNVGLDLGVISPRAFAMLVIMAVVTTLITSPLLEWLNPRAARLDVASHAQHR